MSDALKYTKELLVIDGVPTFNIKESSEGIWAYKPSIFEYYNKRGILKHNPDLDTRPRKIEVQLSVHSLKKEKILFKMYNEILKQYKEKGLKVLESK